MPINSRLYYSSPGSYIDALLTFPYGVYNDPVSGARFYHPSEIAFLSTDQFLGDYKIVNLKKIMPSGNQSTMNNDLSRISKYSPGVVVDIIQKTNYPLRKGIFGNSCGLENKNSIFSLSFDENGEVPAKSQNSLLGKRSNFANKAHNNVELKMDIPLQKNSKLSLLKNNVKLEQKILPSFNDYDFNFNQPPEIFTTDGKTEATTDTDFLHQHLNDTQNSNQHSIESDLIDLDMENENEELFSDFDDEQEPITDNQWLHFMLNNTIEKILDYWTKNFKDHSQVSKFQSFNPVVYALPVLAVKSEWFEPGTQEFQNSITLEPRGVNNFETPDEIVDQSKYYGYLFQKAYSSSMNNDILSLDRVKDLENRRIAERDDKFVQFLEHLGDSSTETTGGVAVLDLYKHKVSDLNYPNDRTIDKLYFYILEADIEDDLKFNAYQIDNNILSDPILRLKELFIPNVEFPLQKLGKRLLNKTIHQQNKYWKLEYPNNFDIESGWLIGEKIQT
jgi:hypothetical protein